MLAYYTVDDKSRVFVCCYYADYVIPNEDWKLADIDDVPFCNSDGIALYKEVDGEIVARTAQEIQEDEEDLPILDPTETEILRADVDYLTMENEYLEGQSEIDRADIDYLLMLLDE